MEKLFFVRFMHAGAAGCIFLKEGKPEEENGLRHARKCIFCRNRKKAVQNQ